ncbi:MAG: hypothetical protein CME69_11800 [Halobacteriovorax sp.]|nr:hypothetical protein [Halobacteriovorax sp.]
MTIFKKTKTEEIILLYPTPVIKDKKYLIQTGSEVEARVKLALLNSGILKTPLEDKTIYEKVRVHKDGKTKVYQLNEVSEWLTLENRKLNIEKAKKVEDVLKNKIISLFEKDSNIDEQIKKVLKVYQAQINCSECQKLGIKELLIPKFIQLLNSL